MTINEPLREKIIRAMTHDKELADASFNDMKNFLVRSSDQHLIDFYMAGWVAGYGAAFSHKHDGPVPNPIEDDDELDERLKEMAVQETKASGFVPPGMFQ